MTISMYQASVPVMSSMLGNLKQILAKAEAHATARKIDPAVFTNARLCADMLPLTKQIQIATDFAKGIAGRLAGVELPSYEDKETTFAELYARIDKTLAYINGIPASQIDGSEERDVSIPLRTETMQFKGQAYLLNFGLPNFYFHVVTAYAILRHLGVEIGKLDYMGAR